MEAEGRALEAEGRMQAEKASAGAEAAELAQLRLNFATLASILPLTLRPTRPGRRPRAEASHPTRPETLTTEQSILYAF